MNRIPNFLNSFFSCIIDIALHHIRILIGLSLSLLFVGSAFAAASCPAEQRMYYVGAAAPATAYKTLPLSSWEEGKLTQTYTFLETPSAGGNKSLTINFSTFLDKYTTYSSQPPYYGSLPGATANAITMIHNSTATVDNHVMDVTVSIPVEKLGYVIQDIDSARDANDRVPYREAVNVASTGGTLTFQPNFHTRNITLDMVTSILRVACNGDATNYACPIEATWGAKTANSTFRLTHSNQFSQYNGAHVLGYSDFYFCLAPAKLVVKKSLSGTRVNSNDQFEIVVTGGTVAANSFTTTGTGSSITNGTSATLSLVESTSYTITERVMNGSTLGDIANYNATYTCTNTTTGSTTVMPTTAMSYNATAKTRSFTFSSVTYGDEITCTITNAPAYTFSGTVFDDNGGITAADSTKQNITSTFTANSAYFNGILDSNESGIFDSALQVTLTNCNGTKVITSSANPQTVSSLGKYNFTVQSGALPTRICLVETEPTSWVYSVDTTANTREVSLTNGTYIYNNLDFGEVKADNTALVLIKYQYVHECDSNLNYISIADTSNPSTGFSRSAPSSDVIPGKCIAYKIEAYNRGHISLADIQISDILQNVKVKSEFYLPKASAVPSEVFKTTNQTAPIGQNGTIISDKFTLSNTASSTTTSKATLYFNTKYGTTVNAQ